MLIYLLIQSIMCECFIYLGVWSIRNRTNINYCGCSKEESTRWQNKEANIHLHINVDSIDLVLQKCQQIRTLCANILQSYHSVKHLFDIFLLLFVMLSSLMLFHNMSCLCFKFFSSHVLHYFRMFFTPLYASFFNINAGALAIGFLVDTALLYLMIKNRSTL